MPNIYSHYNVAIHIIITVPLSYMTQTNLRAETPDNITERTDMCVRTNTDGHMQHQ